MVVLEITGKKKIISINFSQKRDLDIKTFHKPHFQSLKPPINSLHPFTVGNFLYGLTIIFWIGFCIFWIEVQLSGKCRLCVSLKPIMRGPNENPIWVMLSPLSNLDRKGFSVFPLNHHNCYQDQREEDLIATINHSCLWWFKQVCSL